MVQTLTITADGSFTVNWGGWSHAGTISDVDLPDNFIALAGDYLNALSNFGGSQIHLEQNTFRSFCHVNKGQEVSTFDLDEFAPEVKFSSVMALEQEVYDSFFPEPEPEQNVEVNNENTEGQV